MALSIRHQRFVAALLNDPMANATKAYEQVYPAVGNAASSCASQLLADPEIRAAVDEGNALRLKRMELTADDVLRDIALGVTSDGGELGHHVLDCCRHCYGEGHQYQRTPKEYREAIDAYMFLNGTKDPAGLNFKAEGGIGFDPRKPPNDACPECFGRGVSRVLPKDTRYLTEAGRRAYAGIKMTKHGPELVLRSRDKAMEIAAKHTGVARENIKLETVRDLTDEQIAAKTAALEAKLKGTTP